MIRQRELGNQGLEVSELGLGCAGFSNFYGPFDEKEVLRTLHRAIEMGVTFFDTADVYGPYISERLVGAAIRSSNNELTIATKCGFQLEGSGRITGINCRPEYIVKACDASLERLGVDTIDLYYLHRADSTVPIEESVGAMAGLVQAGKIRFIGLSETSPDTVRRAHETWPVSAVQTEYSLFSREPETEILPALRRLGIGFVAYSPLGRGLLTGQIGMGHHFNQGDYRLSLPRFDSSNLKSNLFLVEKLKSMARERNMEPAQLALAWVLAKGTDIVAIPGSKRTANLEQNLAASLVRLSEDEISQLEEEVPARAVTGQRYPDMTQVNR
ncbi:MAG TPA: aldo/keto reductase [Blastocatellia bacterium]